MTKTFLILSLSTSFTTLTTAGPVSYNYNTTGVFNCNSVAHCVASSTGTATNNVVTVNGISLTYLSIFNNLVAPAFYRLRHSHFRLPNYGSIHARRRLPRVEDPAAVPSFGVGSFGRATIARTVAGTGTSTAQINFSADNTSSALCASCSGVYINPGPNQVPHLS